jgi:hypothetical protein
MIGLRSSCGWLLAVVGAVLWTAATGAAQTPPDVRYLRFDTEHFRVVFPDGMEDFARRAAAAAEWAYAGLSDGFVEPPPGRIALVIADPTDFPNATATPIPSNRVVLLATPDIASSTLNYYTDWVDVTLAHELTHIFHLGRADGIWRIGQAVLGRAPFLFPAFYQPRWVIEGLATYYESRLTGAGRAYGSRFPSLLAAAAAGGAFRPVDGADGISPIWPAGHTPYAYGGLFFRAMAERHGDAALGEFVRRGARRLPYLANWAAGEPFGATLTGAWNEWSREFRSEAERRADSLRAGGMTVGVPRSEVGWVVASPRYAPNGGRLAFTIITPTDDPATVVVDAATGRVVSRRRRNGTGGHAWSADSRALLLSQPEFRDRYRVYRDLYHLDTETGDERRLTRVARLSSPDLAPDGRTLVAVQTGEASNRLVRVDLQTLEIAPLTELTDSVNWEHPRWSPDGALIAAERWVEGGVIDLVVLSRSGEPVWQVTRDDALDVTPAWSPDGRYLLWASDRAGASDIYAAEVPEGVRSESGAGARDGRVWRVTRTLGGARDPDVSPDGKRLAYVALRPRGMRVEEIAFAPAAWEPTGPVTRRLRPPAAPPAPAAAAGTPARPYSPFPSLWPKWWLPVVYTGGAGVGTFVGATTAGTDDVRRHLYAVLLGWRIDAESVEGAAFYRYAGLGDPLVELAAWQDFTARQVRTGDGTIVAAVEREREARLTLRFLRPRVRSAFSIAPRVGVEETRFTPVDPDITFADATFTDAIVGLTAGYSRARAYPRSVSAERGFGVVLDLSHRRFTDEFDKWRLSAETFVRAYLALPAFGYAHHVLAARVALGVSESHGRAPEAFELGGVPGRPLAVAPGVAVGAGSPYPVRGFDEGVVLGDRIANGSLEYRFPLALVGRGWGLWPVLLDRLSASLFVDAGAVWVGSSGGDLLASSGAELGLDLGLAYSLSYRFRLGLARRWAAPAPETTGWSAYLSAGLAF